MTTPTAPATVSRCLATGAVIVAGDATASDLAVWLAGVSRAVAANPVVEGLANPVDMLMTRQQAAADVPVRSLMGLVGVRRMALLRPMVGRLQGTQVRLMGLADTVVPAMLGWETVAVMSPGPGLPERRGTLQREPERTSETAALWLPARLVAEAHVANDTGALPPTKPVEFDLAAVGRMRSRYSPLLYLRVLAWLSGQVPLRSGWSKRFVGSGRAQIRVPVPDAGLLIGVDALRRKADLDRLALAPAKADLAAAGVNLHVEWIRLAGYEQVFTHLALTVSLREARPEAKPRTGIRKLRLKPRVPAGAAA
ncbi:hypothetical protein GOFOIKOB_0318 [Methylobacterium tardum]|jgi:hypothetical protein|uniref:Uncharacterized protein n=1 Tax=Methylobacterium tardum TaxID=374432 RepID=A0AA37TCU2_9HYPH|nr:hypothetical protein [Methylobacterium tardum]GJE47297.1 hypothetical protein GOFOIKOB_0318 [Methylobacterium tardum]GLS71331.1 hypothetical protein GCM10007890_33440 [Methylobacterium tardum]